MSAILAMDHFQNTFHSGTTGIKVSLIFSLYTVTDDNDNTTGKHSLSSTVSVGEDSSEGCADHGSTEAAKGVPQLVVGRFVLGLGISIMTVAGR
jgi:hypothetical protein